MANTGEWQRQAKLAKMAELLSIMTSSEATDRQVSAAAKAYQILQGQERGGLQFLGTVGKTQEQLIQQREKEAKTLSESALYKTLVAEQLKGEYGIKKEEAKGTWQMSKAELQNDTKRWERQQIEKGLDARTAALLSVQRENALTNAESAQKVAEINGQYDLTVENLKGESSYQKQQLIEAGGLQKAQITAAGAEAKRTQPSANFSAKMQLRATTMARASNSALQTIFEGIDAGTYKSRGDIRMVIADMGKAYGGALTPGQGIKALNIDPSLVEERAVNYYRAGGFPAVGVKRKKVDKNLFFLKPEDFLK